VNTFDCRETRRSFRASSGDNSRTNTDAGRDTTTSRITATRSSCPRAAAEWWTRVTGVYFSAAPLGRDIRPSELTQPEDMLVQRDEMAAGWLSVARLAGQLHQRLTDPSENAWLGVGDPLAIRADECAAWRGFSRAAAASRLRRSFSSRSSVTTRWNFAASLNVTAGEPSQYSTSRMR
jgi:hypothetical protein